MKIKKFVRMICLFVLTVVIGISAGFSVAYLLLFASGSDLYIRRTANRLNEMANRKLLKMPTIEYDDTSVADALADKIRVLCWVLTHPRNHYTKAVHVKATWGKRCNILLFMSTKNDESLPTIELPAIEGTTFLWSKTKAAFKYVYDLHRDDADWFLKADDDTYVIMENLRYMLVNYSTSEPLYFGYTMKPFVTQGYMSGGAGYVISREALDRFVNKALPSASLCYPGEDGSEDVEMGICLSKVGVKAMDTRDSKLRGRFFTFIPEQHLLPDHNTSFWYWKTQYYKTSEFQLFTSTRVGFPAKKCKGFSHAADLEDLISYIRDLTF